MTGTLNLLEEAVAAGVGSFVFTSTTSAFGRALTPPPGAPAAWITEDVAPVPRNIYGVTKTAAEDLCELFHRDHGLACLILRTSRFFPEADDRDDVRGAYDDVNLKVNELLYRRVDLEDVVTRTGSPWSGAARSASGATSSAPPRPSPVTTWPTCARRARGGARGSSRTMRRSTSGPAGSMFPSIERVYVNERRARPRLAPRYDFGYALDRLERGRGPTQPSGAGRGSEGLPRSRRRGRTRVADRPRGARSDG